MKSCSCNLTFFELLRSNAFGREDEEPLSISSRFGYDSSSPSPPLYNRVDSLPRPPFDRFLQSEKVLE